MCSTSRRLELLEIDGYELPVGGENRAQFLFKSNKSFELMSHLSSPKRNSSHLPLFTPTPSRVLLCLPG